MLKADDLVSKLITSKLKLEFVFATPYKCCKNLRGTFMARPAWPSDALKYNQQ